MRVEMNLDVQHCHDDMDTKIAAFKQDSEKMNELNLFLDSVLDEAQKSAEIKLQTKLEEERPKNESSYKDPCDKTYFSAKCAADFSPDTFMFP